MQVPLISGVVSTPDGDFLVSYPVNREPVLRDTSLSNGYLGVPPGITQVGSGPGEDRGGINWNGVCYRVMGTTLVSVSSAWAVTELGDVGSGGPCAFDYSFDNLIVNSGTRLYYWNATAGLRQVTDVDLGVVLDAIYVDGYTMTTDGTALVVTDLNDPMAVNPLKYGSAEESPDAVTGLVHMHSEVYALGRYTIQVFQNIGGSGFPFQTSKGSTAPFGCVGARAKCKYLGSLAFVGGEENAATGVYVLGAGDAQKISSAEVDADLAKLSDAELAAVWLEARVRDDDQRLLLHTPNRTWGFSAQVSKKSSIKTWCQYVSAPLPEGRYEGRGLVLAYGKWIVGSSSGQIGVLDTTTAQHYGADVAWQFDTTLFYNDAQRGILGSIELIGTPGRGTADGRVFFSYTKDGLVWSQERVDALGPARRVPQARGVAAGHPLRDLHGPQVPRA
jgi:hypothetical protein